MPEIASHDFFSPWYICLFFLIVGLLSRYRFNFAFLCCCGKKEDDPKYQYRYFGYPPFTIPFTFKPNESDTPVIIIGKNNLSLCIDEFSHKTAASGVQEPSCQWVVTYMNDVGETLPAYNQLYADNNKNKNDEKKSIDNKDSYDEIQMTKNSNIDNNNRYTGALTFELYTSKYKSISNTNASDNEKNNNHNDKNNDNHNDNDEKDSNPNTNTEKKTGGSDEDSEAITTMLTLSQSVPNNNVVELEIEDDEDDDEEEEENINVLKKEKSKKKNTEMKTEQANKEEDENTKSEKRQYLEFSRNFHWRVEPASKGRYLDDSLNDIEDGKNGDDELPMYSPYWIDGDDNGGAYYQVQDEDNDDNERMMMKKNEKNAFCIWTFVDGRKTYLHTSDLGNVGYIDVDELILEKKEHERELQANSNSINSSKNESTLYQRCKFYFYKLDKSQIDVSNSIDLNLNQYGRSKKNINGFNNGISYTKMADEKNNNNSNRMKCDLTCFLIVWSIICRIFRLITVFWPVIDFITDIWAIILYFNGGLEYTPYAVLSIWLLYFNNRLYFYTWFILEKRGKSDYNFQDNISLYDIIAASFIPILGLEFLHINFVQLHEPRISPSKKLRYIQIKWYWCYFNFFNKLRIRRWCWVPLALSVWSYSIFYCCWVFINIGFTYIGLFNIVTNYNDTPVWLIYYFPVAVYTVLLILYITFGCGCWCYACCCWCCYGCCDCCERCYHRIRDCSFNCIGGERVRKIFDKIEPEYLSQNYTFASMAFAIISDIFYIPFYAIYLIFKQTAKEFMIRSKEAKFIFCKTKNSKNSTLSNHAYYHSQRDSLDRNRTISCYKHWKQRLQNEGLTKDETRNMIVFKLLRSLQALCESLPQLLLQCYVYFIIRSRFNDISDDINYTTIATPRTTSDWITYQFYLSVFFSVISILQAIYLLLFDSLFKKGIRRAFDAFAVYAAVLAGFSLGVENLDTSAIDGVGDGLFVEFPSNNDYISAQSGDTAPNCDCDGDGGCCGDDCEACDECDADLGGCDCTVM